MRHGKKLWKLNVLRMTACDNINLPLLVEAYSAPMIFRAAYVIHVFPGVIDPSSGTPMSSLLWQYNQ